jgi:hypothetical protein
MVVTITKTVGPKGCDFFSIVQARLWVEEQAAYKGRSCFYVLECHESIEID